MNVKLVVIGGKNNGRFIPITIPKFLVGRAEDCHLRPNSDLVSRHHCVILIENGRVFARDLGSRNGTLVNGECIEKPRELRTGDKLQVGPLHFEVAIEVDIVAPKRPKVQSLEEAAARTVGSAAEKPIDDELDIGNWIAETREESADTKSLNTPQTGTLAMNAPPVDEPPADEEKPGTEADNKTSKQESAASLSSSGIHGLKKPKAIDSQTAAAETLRAFFNRK